MVAAVVGGLMVASVLGMSIVKKQFFPISDRPEVMVEVQMPYGTSIGQTSETTRKVEAWLLQQPESEIVTAYIGQGAPRFFLAISPELPDPSFAKIVVRTANQAQRDALKLRLREAIAQGLAPQAQVRASQIVFGPYSPFPVAYRVSGPDPQRLRDIAGQVHQVLHDSPMMRTVNSDWGVRTPVMRFTLDQDRLQAMGLTSAAVAQQLQFLLSGVPVTTVREDIRTVQVMARSAGGTRHDVARVGDFTLTNATGQRSEEHTSELQSPCNLVCRLLLAKKKTFSVYNAFARAWFSTYALTGESFRVMAIALPCGCRPGFYPIADLVRVRPCRDEEQAPPV